ncbi:MAG: EF-hand domain-containing protein [Planctomycetes bacterium]|nr:EF-hand domain-containing protein [Planctomycetota bacterium]
MLTTSALAGHLTHGLLAASRLSPVRKSIPAEGLTTPSAFKSKAAPTAQLATAQPAKPLVHTIAKNTVVPSGPMTLRNIAQPTVTKAIPAPADSQPPVTDNVDTPNVLITADQELQQPYDPLQARVDALLADWGQADSPYDFNGDGTVDPYDLTILLGGNFPPQEAPPQQPTVAARPAERVATRLTSAIFAARDRDRDGTIREKEFAGGQHLFRRIDRDGDGVISRTDLHDAITDSLKVTLRRDEPLRLGHFTRSWLSAFNRHGKADGPAKMSEHIPSMRRHEHNRAVAEHIAHALQPQFSSNPTDIRQVVDKSNLADDQKKMTLDRIAAWHPRGLKVSLVG